MNLYIIQSVLCDSTDSMVCIAAENLDQCRELFIEEFEPYNYNQKYIRDFDDAIKKQDYKVLQVLNQKAEVVSFVCGGS